MRNKLKKALLGVTAGLMSIGLVVSVPMAASAADIGTTVVSSDGDNLITLDFQNTVSTTETDTVHAYIITTWTNVTPTSATLTNVAVSIDNTYPYAFNAEVGYNGSGGSGTIGNQTVIAGTAFHQATNITFNGDQGIYGQIYVKFKGTLMGGPATVTAQYDPS